MTIEIHQPELEALIQERMARGRVYCWAKLTALAKRNGIQIGTPDGLIPATALEHGLTLLTRNVKDFGITGVPILNPWELTH